MEKALVGRLYPVLENPLPGTKVHQGEAVSPPMTIAETKETLGAN